MSQPHADPQWTWERLQLRARHVADGRCLRTQAKTDTADTFARALATTMACRLADATVHPQGLRSSAHCPGCPPALALQILRHGQIAVRWTSTARRLTTDFASVEGARRAALRPEHHPTPAPLLYFAAVLRLSEELLRQAKVPLTRANSGAKGTRTPNPLLAK
jgi:hypothetical protein